MRTVTPEQMCRDLITITKLTSALDRAYADRWPDAHRKPTYGDHGRSAGVAKPVEAAVMAGWAINAHLGQASEHVERALSLLTQALAEVARATDLLDAGHPLSIERSERYLQRPATQADQWAAKGARKRREKRAADHVTPWARSEITGE